MVPDDHTLGEQTILVEWSVAHTCLSHRTFSLAQLVQAIRLPRPGITPSTICMAALEAGVQLYISMVRHHERTSRSDTVRSQPADAEMGDLCKVLSNSGNRLND
jgi:hypothetical protein